MRPQRRVVVRPRARFPWVIVLLAVGAVGSVGSFVVSLSHPDVTPVELIPHKETAEESLARMRHDTQALKDRLDAVRAGNY